MAGQGTAALELIEDGGPLDLLLVPVGGGGLIAGCATAATGARARLPRSSASSPRSATTRALARRRASASACPVGRTIADGQQLDIPGERTFPVIRERVARVVTVTDAEIVAAMRFAFERLKLVLEPSGASALAALLHGKVEAGGRRTGVDPLGRERRRGPLPRADRLASRAITHRDPHRLHLGLPPRGRGPLRPRARRAGRGRGLRDRRAWRSCPTTSR